MNMTPVADHRRRTRRTPDVPVLPLAENWGTMNMFIVPNRKNIAM
jgi:hypothetical protein